MSKQTVLITGSSTGFGKRSALDFQAKGWNVVATMRNPDSDSGKELAKLDNVAVLALDVTKPDTIKTAIAAAIEKFTKIDVLVNNAGFASLGIFEGCGDEPQRQFDVNFFGVLRVTEAILPHFRANKAGKIVNVSSIGGLISGPQSSLYFASKWAVEGWAESLSYELMPFGIQIKNVNPGAFKTDILGAMFYNPGPKDVPEYAAQVKGMQDMMAALGDKVAECQPVVDTIFSAATDSNANFKRFVVYDSEDMFGKLYQAREAGGYEAQVGANVAAGKPPAE